MAVPLLLVTGTNTEVGKTATSVGLLRVLKARGLSVRAIKPVESGVPDLPPAQRDLHTDGGRLAAATGQPAPARALQELATPVAPPLAADAEGTTLDVAGWRETIAAHQRGTGVDLVLVEGAGGVLSPLTWQQTVLDLFTDTHAPHVLLVAADRLGTISQTRAALEAIDRRGLPLLGVVMNEVSERPPDDASFQTNATSLRRCCPDVVVLPVGFGPDRAGLEALAEHVVARLGLT